MTHNVGLSAVLVFIMACGCGLLGCQVELEEGQFECASNLDCPEGWFCNIADDRKCYSDTSSFPEHERSVVDESDDGTPESTDEEDSKEQFSDDDDTESTDEPERGTDTEVGRGFENESGSSSDNRDTGGGMGTQGLPDSDTATGADTTPQSGSNTGDGADTLVETEVISTHAPDTETASQGGVPTDTASDNTCQFQCVNNCFQLGGATREGTCSNWWTACCEVPSGSDTGGGADTSVSTDTAMPTDTVSQSPTDTALPTDTVIATDTMGIPTDTTVSSDTENNSCANPIVVTGLPTTVTGSWSDYDDTFVPAPTGSGCDAASVDVWFAVDVDGVTGFTVQEESAARVAILGVDGCVTDQCFFSRDNPSEQWAFDNMSSYPQLRVVISRHPTDVEDHFSIVFD